MRRDKTTTRTFEEFQRANHCGQVTYEELEKTCYELERWKQEQIEVENQWDRQAVAREMDLPLGKAIAPNILPFIKKIKAENEILQRRLKEIFAIGHDENCIFCGLKDFLCTKEIPENNPNKPQ